MNEDFIEPTQWAINCYRELTKAAARLRGSKLPTGHQMANGSGGIRIEWQSEDRQREVRLVIDSNEKARTYLYFEVGSQYGTDEATAYNLRGYLDWLETDNRFYPEYGFVETEPVPIDRLKAQRIDIAYHLEFPKSEETEVAITPAGIFVTNEEGTSLLVKGQFTFSPEDTDPDSPWKRRNQR